MANFYYIKNGGSADGADVDGGNGIYSSMQTGTWSGTGSEYFDGLAAALAGTVTPTAGDFLCFSSVHTKTNGANTTFTIPAGVTLFSALDTERETYTAGAEEGTTSGNYDLIINGANVFAKGLTTPCGDDMILGNANGSNLSLEDCVLYSHGSGDKIILGFAPSSAGVKSEVHLLNTQFRFGNVGASVQPRAGPITIRGCSLHASSSAPTTLFIMNTGGRGVCDMVVEDCDFAEVTGNVIDPSSTAFNIRMDRVLFGNGFTMLSSALSNISQQLTARAVGSATGDEYYSTYFANECGVVVEDTANYIDATYDGTNEYSYQMVSTTDARLHRHLRFPIATIWVSANPTIKIEVIHEGVGSGTSGDLQNDEFWIEFESNDASEPVQGNINNASRITNPPPFSTAADLTDSAQAWTETLTGQVEQYVEETLTCSAGIVTVWGCLSSKSSDNSALTVYVHPLPIVS